jgi:colanic acid/amylovoran biosynthesis protein
VGSTPRPITVFAPCAFSWENKGDAALLFALAQSLEAEFGPVDLTFTSFTPATDAPRYGFRFLRMPLDPNSIFGGGLRAFLKRRGGERLAAYAAMAHLGVFLLLMRAWVSLYRRRPEAIALLPRRVREVVAAAERADVVVGMPGGYLLAPAFTNVWWLYHVATLALVQMLGKPLVLYPSSLGPFPGAHRAIARRLLPGCDLVMVRERVSERLALALGVPRDRVRLVADAAFLFADDGRGAAELEPVRRRLAGAPRPLVGVSVREHHFPGSPDPAAAYRTYLGAVAGAVDRLVAETGATPVFVPQVLGAGGGDVAAARAAMAYLAEPTRAVLLEDDLSPHALTVLYGDFEMMIGTRMHANILAMVAGTPTAAIAYGHKTTGIMELLGLAEYVIPIEEVETRLDPMVAALWRDRAAVRASLPGRMAEARAWAGLAAVEVRRLVAGPSVPEPDAAPSPTPIGAAR